MLIVVLLNHDVDDDDHHRGLVEVWWHVFWGVPIITVLLFRFGWR